MSQTLLWSLLAATGETVYMVLASTAVSLLLGLPLGVWLFVTRPGQFYQHRCLHQALSFVVNVGRSVPYIILMIAVIPLTRWLVGTSIGTTATIVPLSLSAIPFFARMVEGALLELNEGLVEAALSMGASPLQIIRKVLLPEALPSIVNALTITLIALIGYSAMAGVVGGGGLGDLAIRYGYQRFNVLVMIETIVILVVLVQLAQFAGDVLSRRIRGTAR